MKSISIICPLYNAAEYIEKLHNSFLMQENVNIIDINYILTESSDRTEEYLKENHINYKKIQRSEFSHSLVREKSAYESEADIVVFVTQDVVIEDKNWLYNLTKDIDNEIVATYSRQITKYNNIEKYTRERNYPKESSIVSKEDIDKLGLRTFFFSDASSAINRNVFVELNGYDHKNLPISEDMYIAYKIIMNGYKIKYCADSVVYHSHNFTLKQIYDRYKLTGNFMKENAYLDQYGTNGSGADLAKYILKRILQEHHFKLLLRYPFDMAARYIGMKVGKRNGKELFDSCCY
ncbi:MAG: glycosyltransferase family 2 protein [Clostridia bacterium]|nr:glycosyltransferase family 2 protein [Clostridia bacterium]